jgi:cytochrome c oxidase assembly factor CtaG
VALLPPLGVLATEHVFAETIQFSILGYVAPALLALGLPDGVRASLVGSLASRQPARGSSPRDATAHRRRHVVAAAVFVLVAIAWRLPPLVDAVERHPLLVLVEALCLVTAGTAMWVELTDSSAGTASTRGPVRMTMATVAMWTIWANGYMLGFAGTAWYAAFAHFRGGLSVIADQEIACWVLWAVPGACLVPVFFSELVRWLRREADPEPRAQTGAGRFSRFAPSAAATVPLPGGRVGITPIDGSDPLK